MAKALSKVSISLKNGTGEYHAFLKKYHAEFVRESSTEKGHVYWSAPVGQWILALKRGNNMQLTFHAKDDCPCKMI